MVSLVGSLAAAAAVVSCYSNLTEAALNVSALSEGTYYKPTGSIVSGVVGTTTPFRRSPCPALNTLANHGYLPRDGQNVTKTVLGPAIMSIYNLGEDATAILLALVPDTFTLDYLSTHNAIEHDASLIHNDAYFGGDPAQVNLTLAEDLLARGEATGLLGVTEIGATRKVRLADSLANNPNVTFGTTQQTLAFLESSILLLGFGSKTNESVAVDTARSFLVDEKIPDGWTRASSAISATEARATAAEIAAASV